MRTVKEKITWIDILKPNEADLKILQKLHQFHPIILKELTQPSPRTRIEEHDNYLFIAFHVPVYDPAIRTSRRSEIDILVTKDKIITIHYENLEQIDSLFSDVLTNKIFRKTVLGSNTLIPLYHIFLKQISFSLRQLRHIEERVSKIAQETFAGHQQKRLEEISYIKRDILDYRLITRPQEKFFSLLTKMGTAFWGKKNNIYLRDLENEHTPIHSNLDNYYEIIESLETTNVQLLNSETNATMKKLTAGAFLFSIPLFFIFSVGVPHIYDIIASTGPRFWTSFFVVLLIMIALAGWFKKKKIF